MLWLYVEDRADHLGARYATMLPATHRNALDVVQPRFPPRRHQVPNGVVETVLRLPYPIGKNVHLRGLIDVPEDLFHLEE